MSCPFHLPTRAIGAGAHGGSLSGYCCSPYGGRFCRPGVHVCQVVLSMQKEGWPLACHDLSEWGSRHLRVSSVCMINTDGLRILPSSRPPRRTAGSKVLQLVLLPISGRAPDTAGRKPARRGDAHGYEDSFICRGEQAPQARAKPPLEKTMGDIVPGLRQRRANRAAAGRFSAAQHRTD